MINKNSMDTKTSVDISIIIPVYNTADYLDDCLQSILPQSEGAEIILIDDGSTDTSPELIKRYEERFDNIRSIRQPHQLQGAARNKGLLSARGKYIIFLDSDDMMAGDAVQNLRKKMNERPYDFVTFDAEIIGDKKEGKSYAEYDRQGKVNTGIYTGPKFWSEYARKGLIPYTCWSMILRKSFIDSNTMSFQEGIFYEDNVWVAKAFLNAGEICFLPEKFYIYRQRKNSTINSSFSAEHLHSSISVIENLLALDKEYHDDISAMLIREMIRINIYNFGLIVSDRDTAFSIDDIRMVLKRIRHYNNEENSLLYRDTYFDIILRIARALKNTDNREAVILRDELLSVIKAELSLSPDKKIGVYGTGVIADRFLEEVTSYCDRADIFFIETERKNTRYKGFPVFSVNELQQAAPDVIIIASTKYRSEMRKNIADFLKAEIPVFIYG